MKIQWLGQAAFKITGETTSVLIDPFLSGNSLFTGSFEEAVDGVSHVLVSHAHNDHVGDTFAILERTEATAVVMVEFRDYIKSIQPDARVIGLCFGGNIETPEGLTVELVPATHSSSFILPDGRAVYGGEAAGIVLGMDGYTIYHMGDTGVFSDMALINEFHKPDIGLVPIGGRYTMDARKAAWAINRYFECDTVIPCHYMGAPKLAQTADEFVALVENARVEALAPMEALEI